MGENSAATIIILDTSASMAERFKGGLTRAEFARKSLEYQARSLCARDLPFGIKQFDGRDGVETLLPLDFHSEAMLNKALANTRPPLGPTPLALSIVEAARDFEGWTNRPRSIVALSDGMDSSSRAEGVSLESAIRKLRPTEQSFDSAIRFFILALDRFSTEQIKAVNDLISRFTYGGFYEVPTEASVEDSTLIVDQVFQLASIDRQYTALLREISAMRSFQSELEQKLKQRQSSQKTFDSAFGWTVLVGFLATFALIGWSSSELRKADSELAADIQSRLDHVSKVVESLWEVWGN